MERDGRFKIHSLEKCKRVRPQGVDTYTSVSARGDKNNLRKQSTGFSRCFPPNSLKISPNTPINSYTQDDNAVMAGSRIQELSDEDEDLNS